MEFLLKWSISMVSGSAQAVGAKGEDFSMALFRELGFWAGQNERASKCGDIRIARKDTGEEFNVEVKTAREGEQGYNFCLRRDGGKTDCSHAHYVLLLCISPSGGIVPYLIPVYCIPSTQKNLKIAKSSLTKAEGWGKFRFDIANLFTFWELADHFQMFSGAPYRLKWDIQLSTAISGELEIIVGDEG